MFNHVVPYGYLPPTVYLFISDIEIQTCMSVVVGPRFVTRFYEEQHQPSSGSVWPACPKKGKSGLIAVGVMFRQNLHISL